MWARMVKKYTHTSRHPVSTLASRLQTWLVALGSIYTMMLLMNMRNLVLVFTKERNSVLVFTSIYTKSFYQRKLITHMECGHGCFGMLSRFSTMQCTCRKCNFVLIYVEVGLLLTFLITIKVIKFTGNPHQIPSEKCNKHYLVRNCAIFQ